MPTSGSARSTASWRSTARGSTSVPRSSSSTRPTSAPSPAPFTVEDDRIVAVHRVSCATGAGIPELKQALFALCPAAPELVEEEATLPEFLDYRPTPPARRRFRILRIEGGYRVVGDAPEGDELEEALRAAGIRKGALVEIGDEELEWV